MCKNLHNIRLGCDCSSVIVPHSPCTRVTAGRTAAQQRDNEALEDYNNLDIYKSYKTL